MKKFGIGAGVALALVFVLALITDSLIAARAEHRISHTIFAESNLATPPKVQLAGFPYTAAAVTNELQAITVNATDVNVPGYGLMGVYTSAQYVTVSARDVIQGEIRDAPARKIFTRIQLDGVLLGDSMGIDELLIQNKDDISPRGGWETESIFEGTPEGFTKPATVEMKLRVKEGDVHISPVRILTAPTDTGEKAKIVDGKDLPGDVTQRIREAFTLTLEGRKLPLPNNPVRVYVTGGSMFVESEQFYTRVSIQDLTPRARPLNAQDQPGL
ncbi:MAG TPA: DUF2993 domain-containing protein [Candidatus Corynebacterium gallistercoris]|uniref:DUF2993 domain-containing protein n=1 Tax=Candidatus Corynebacterium gallistercoris TaxID=2838530 RepID=A0A9D1RX21_9CORY|nr:DUF2993 domain-containing protein [Candidatus Corynebacterium gallistercoris]